MKLGINLEDFATSHFSDKSRFNKEYEQQSRHKVRQIQNWGGKSHED
jgi:hypothetical protein